MQAIHPQGVVQVVGISSDHHDVVECEAGSYGNAGLEHLFQHVVAHAVQHQVDRERTMPVDEVCVKTIALLEILWMFPARFVPEPGKVVTGQKNEVPVDETQHAVKGDNGCLCIILVALVIGNTLETAAVGGPGEGDDNHAITLFDAVGTVQNILDIVVVAVDKKENAPFLLSRLIGKFACHGQVDVVLLFRIEGEVKFIDQFL